MVTGRQTPPYIELSLHKYCKVGISYTIPVFKAKQTIILLFMLVYLFNDSSM